MDRQATAPVPTPMPSSPLPAQSLPAWLRPSAATVFAIGIVAFTFLFVNHSVLWHTDVWGHMKFGEALRETGQIPATEPFLFDAAGPRQANHPTAWLSQTLLYETYRAGAIASGDGEAIPAAPGGVEALRGLHAVAVALRCLLLFFAFRCVSGSGPAAVAALLLMLGLSFANIGVLRPQVFGEVCCAAMLLLLSLPRLGWPLQIVAVLLFVLWGNLHGSYLVGLFLWVGYLGGQVLLIFRQAGFDVRAYYRHPRFRELFRVFWVSCVALSFGTPGGVWITANVLAISNHPNIVDMDEWKRIAWDSPWGFAYFASLLVILSTLMLSFVLPQRNPDADPRGLTPRGVIPMGQLIMLGLIGGQTFLHQRMMPWWVMLVPWICVPAWGRFLRLRAERAAANQTEAGWAMPPRLPDAPPGSTAAESAIGSSSLARASRPLLVSVVIVWLGLAWSGLGQWLLGGPPRPLSHSLHPATPLSLAMQLLEPVSSSALPALRDWLTEQRLVPQELRPVFASETQGEFLLWALPPANRPVVYTHVHLMSPAHWQAVMAVKSAQPGWQAHLDRWGVRLVVVEADLHAELCQQLRSAPDVWRVLADDTQTNRTTDPKARLFVAVRR